jgi:cytochrome c peroxidase
LFLPSSMPCAECGASVPRAAADYHACDPQRWVDFQMAAMTSAIASFESDLRTFLTGKEGRFEAWLAARDVRRTA